MALKNSERTREVTVGMFENKPGDIIQRVTRGEKGREFGEMLFVTEVERNGKTTQARIGKLECLPIIEMTENSIVFRREKVEVRAGEVCVVRKSRDD